MAAADLIAKAGPQLVKWGPKAFDFGKSLVPMINPALSVYKEVNARHKAHQNDRKSSNNKSDDRDDYRKSKARRAEHHGRRRPGDSDDDSSSEDKDRQRNSRQGRRGSAQYNGRRQSETGSYDNPARRHAPAAQTSHPPLPYPDADFMIDPSLYNYNNLQQYGRRGSNGSRRNPYIPTLSTPSQEGRDYFDRRASLDQRKISMGSTSGNPYQRFDDREERKRDPAHPDRGYASQPPPDTYAAYPPARKASNTPAPMVNQRPTAAQRWQIFADAADKGIPIDRPPIPRPRQYSTTKQARPSMPERHSSSGRRGSLASSVGGSDAGSVQAWPYSKPGYNYSGKV